ncbi:MAG: AmmeMemoRadiSam system radical SAM enzyme [Elusimicrobia bacterium]|nr:AmmeMemoRadiSam system radical SAM enzyme [Elusimicrobiota bacterium]MBU2615306.1 AmmeMemoRadiSam system radical SAM enzyme [Elusimicrobiota bacterium]
MKESLYYSFFDKGKKLVQCNLCPHNCKIMPDKAGVCHIRKNIEGKLYSLTYGGFSSVNLDPIEKKPLYHFYPGSQILSVGTIGCNFKCSNCQNWEISQAEYQEDTLRELSPEQALELAKRYDSIGIAYTYNEPLINYEWVIETAKLFKKENMKNVLVTNGFVNEQPWENLLPFIDAANIDVKAFKNDFYKSVCQGEIGPVLRSVEIMFKRGKHLEVTYLVIPGKNDSEHEIIDFVDWLSSLSPEIPVHFSRYFPRYKMEEKTTPVETLEMAKKIALKRMKYVYVGNI